MQSLPETRPDDGPVTRVKFIADYLFETEGRGKGDTFKKGAVYDLPDDLAQKFIRRNVAERADKKTPITDKYLVSAAPEGDGAGEGDKGAPKAGDTSRPGGAPQKVDALTGADVKRP